MREREGNQTEKSDQGSHEDRTQPKRQPLTMASFP